MVQEEIVIGVLQMSDRASLDTNAYSSLSGDSILEVLTSYIKSPYRTIFKIIPDEYDLILDTFHWISNPLTAPTYPYVRLGGNSLRS